VQLVRLVSQCLYTDQWIRLFSYVGRLPRETLESKSKATSYWSGSSKRHTSFVVMPVMNSHSIEAVGRIEVWRIG